MKSMNISPAKGNRKLLKKLESRKIDVQTCYQCGRCSGGCPVADYFDLQPMEVVRLASYGMEQQLLSSSTIWLCASCDTCATRCPNDIDITALMDVLRELALRKNIKPAQPRVPAFHLSFMESIKRWGRTYEVGMIGAYKIRSKDFMGDMKLGLNMFRKGKLNLLPHSIEGKPEIREIFAGKGKEYER
ncbi:4Fe-4S dicluster domain-containing protein [Desulfosediminicola flagellatus]|uniref:4Fe-4S dicluster domain-containing protein n=1 Tax=Desulfosediminicola flagellatus TaxID=2569541 RepID=UPI0010AD9298|nr:4Fe-4S dicluster domain-containing protein [Desulfosediminicola flagellatus]